jgi:hypothetical protein
MKKLISAFMIAAVCAVGSAAVAQTTTTKQEAKKSGQATKAAPKTATATVTATCKDGTTYSGKTKKGACSKHGGVKSWDKA